MSGADNSVIQYVLLSLCHACLQCLTAKLLNVDCLVFNHFTEKGVQGNTSQFLS